MNQLLVDNWLAWLDSRPCGYTKRELWQVSRKGASAGDARSPLAWIADQFIAAHPDRARWVWPDPVKGIYHYTLEVDGEAHTFLPPRSVLNWAGMDEGTIKAVTQFTMRATSHARFAQLLRGSQTNVQPMGYLLG